MNNFKNNPKYNIEIDKTSKIKIDFLNNEAKEFFNIWKEEILENINYVDIQLFFFMFLTSMPATINNEIFKKDFCSKEIEVEIEEISSLKELF